VRNHESTFLAKARWGGLKQKVLAWALRTGHAVTGNSQTIVDELHQHFACTAPCHVVYNPVDMQRFAAPSWLSVAEKGVVSNAEILAELAITQVAAAAAGHPKASTAFHVLAVGRLDPQKGFAHLLRAFSQVQAAVPQARLTIVGEGPERDALQKIIQELNLCNVFLPGWSSDIPAVMQSVDVFCLSSLWEGMPNVLLEAMAAGLPVVAFDCPSGPREILQDGQHGLLLPLGNEIALAQALLGLAHKPQERLMWAQRAHARAADFEPQAIAQKWFWLMVGAAGADKNLL
jgi:glycosyltransferase involved in cell wall biosynthesis